jgi:hypothetical protein
VAYRHIARQRLQNNETIPIAVQQLHKYTTVLELLLGSGLHTRMEVQLASGVFCGLLKDYITQSTELIS